MGQQQAGSDGESWATKPEPTPGASGTTRQTLGAATASVSGSAVAQPEVEVFDVVEGLVEEFGDVVVVEGVHHRSALAGADDEKRTHGSWLLASLFSWPIRCLP
jgi:hypothetical protein